MSTDIQPSAESASPPKRWQFRLWHLFALMSYVAVVAGVARWWGIETLAVSFGLGVAWLNYWGGLSFFQRGKPQLATLGIAWGMFLVSLFLPVDTNWSPEGYVAAWFVLTAPVNLAWRQDWLELFKVLCWVPLIDVANFLQLMLPVTAVRLQMGRGKYVAAVHCVSMVAVWTIADPHFSVWIHSLVREFPRDAHRTPAESRHVTWNAHRPGGLAHLCVDQSGMVDRQEDHYSDKYGGGSPLISDSALHAARCSASFLLRPQAG
jgi:hypothetical protein